MIKKTKLVVVLIRATATDGSKKTTTIKLNIVKDGVIGLAIKGNTSMNAGSSMKLTATVKASGSTANTDIGWKSSNKDAANVSSSVFMRTKQERDRQLRLRLIHWTEQKLRRKLILRLNDYELNEIVE